MLALQIDSNKHLLLLQLHTIYFWTFAILGDKYMSSLLREAIVDAKALRDSALKNAETTIIEKYASEVKETLDKLLEQDDTSLGLEEDSGSVVTLNIFRYNSNF